MRRRDFLKLTGLAAAAAAGCHRRNRIRPFVDPPEDVLPGKATWYATTCRECPAGCGVLAKCREGRPIKLEGNPAHPENRGALCALGQAALQGLYNPDRHGLPRVRSGEKSGERSWDEAIRMMRDRLSEARGKVAVWTGHVAGPEENLIAEWIASHGGGLHIAHEPLCHGPERDGFGMAFGDPALPQISLDGADFVLSLGADFLETWIAPVRFARELAEMRRHTEHDRLQYVHAGPRLSMTAASADQWFPLKPEQLPGLGLALLAATLEAGLVDTGDAAEASRLKGALGGRNFEDVCASYGLDRTAVSALAGRLGRVKRPVVLGGLDRHTAALAAILTHVLGNGRAFDFGRRRTLSRCLYGDALSKAVARLTEEKFDVLMVAGANPLYGAPSALALDEVFQKIPFVVCATSVRNETAKSATLSLPLNHPLESWGGVEPFEGLLCAQQPVTRPLGPSWGLGQILSATLGTKAGTGDLRQRLVEANALAGRTPPERERDFQVLLSLGFRDAGSTYKPKRLAQDLSPALAVPPVKEHGLCFLGFPTVALHDGRGADKPWLQELPDPVTRITWGGWIEVHPATAAASELSEGDVVAVSNGARTAEFPVHVWEGIVPGLVAAPLGFGRTDSGRFASSAVGGDAASLLDDGAWRCGITLRPTGERMDHAHTDGSRSQHGRQLARRTGDPEGKHHGPPVSMPLKSGHDEKTDIYPPHDHDTYRWCMVVDLDLCTGCGACVTACYAENNCSVVGRRQVALGREMSWLQIERFLDPSAAAPLRFLPVMCQHCDAAPCEAVCPVYAPHHNKQGMNVQVYNRCVGTRFCAVNCPYKVRRFNWSTYPVEEPLNLQMNPDVTCRTKGVMEKCSFCVQRIKSAGWKARAEHRQIRDAEVTPACAQTCPTGAMTFGNLLDPASRVSRLVRDARAYQVLGELNTKPAVIYLKRISRS